MNPSPNASRAGGLDDSPRLRPGTLSKLPLTIPESAFQRTVIDYARRMKWLVVHYRSVNQRRGDGSYWGTPLQGNPGAPDLILARDGRVLLVELKRHGGRVSPAQKAWLDALGDNARLWTPTQWNDGTIWGDLR